ncbi:MAG: hypothetical protein DHS20C17_32740 [Cyclobacteriaceae bacterium]|nr:MAG: hypothetical protein DHS20C17_32740 [Cyclobacteriaceae bacterium]
MKKLHLVLSLCITMGLGLQHSLQAQTYATPELKQKAEAEDAAKLQKIQKDPQAYRAKDGNPDQFLKAKSTEKPVPITYAAPVDINCPDLYKLIAIETKDPDKKHTEQEMKAFQQEAEGEFKKMNIVLDWENRRWYFIPRNNQIKPTERKFWVEGDVLQFLECEECQDNTFTITEHTDNALILQLQPQDEGQYFVFSFTFKK